MHISATAGKVTIRNAVCTWGLLELPVRSGTFPTGGDRWTAKAVARLNGEPRERIVELTLTASDVLGVYAALEGGA